MKTLKELMDLKDRVAVITGGAGHLGAVIAEALAELGCTICVADRPSSNLCALQEQLSVSWQVDVEAIEVDLEQEDQRVELQEQITRQFGRVDILINNAAFVGDSTLKGWGVHFEEQQIDTWRRALEVNLTTTFHLSQLLTPLLRYEGNGSIVNIGSIYGLVGTDLRLYEGTQMGNPAAYAASKGGVVQLTRWLSSVLAPDIRVNCISPGGIAREQPKSFVERYIARTPMGRMGTEEDFKGAIAFFSSDMSAWVTGENLIVDGGWTVW